MKKIFHDFIIIEPEASTGVLKQHNDNINSGIVKDFGDGYRTEVGELVTIEDIEIGDKLLFTQHLEIEVNGEKVYIVRYRDVIQGERIDNQV